jgi:O-succinylbenzoate synthase
MLEQPLPARDFAGLAFLQKRLATPICLDESIETVADVETMVALGAGRIVNIKPGRVGGLAESLRIHDECARHGIPVWCGGMLETGLGRAYNAALASLPNFSLPGDLYPASSYLASDIAAPEAVVEGGSVAVPDGPGVGVEVDVERVEGMAVRREVV